MIKRFIIYILVLTVIVSLSLSLGSKFLKPAIEEKFLEALKAALGREIELAGFDISLFRGVIFLKDLKIKNPRPIKYYSYAAADEVVLDLDLLFILFTRISIWSGSI